MKAIWTIARRELRALFDHPTGYILLVVFLAINDFLFFRQAYLMQVASLRPMMDLLPWVFLFFVPAVTMRAIAEDARTGTMEVVLAQPITEAELLGGKYLGQVIFICVALLLTVPVPIGLALGADLHAGVMVAQYVGAALLTVGLVGVGVWSSSITRNQITAFILGTAVLFVFILVGLDPLLVGLPAELGAYAASLSILSHFQNVARGVIDLRDVVYFATLAAVFLFFAYQSLMARKLAPHGETVKRLRLGVFLLTAAAIVTNLFGRHIGGRLDLTPGKSYTLSPATRELLRSVPDIVTLKLFASAEVPPQIALLKRDVDDLLRDYRSAGAGKVRVVVKDPAADTAAKTEAGQLGIGPVQFNVVGRSELQVKQGFLGLAVQYANAKEVIPVVDRTDDLEYTLSTYIRQLTRTSKPVIGFVSSNRDAMLGRRFDRLLEEMRKSYDVRQISLAEDSQPTPSTKVLVLAGTPDSLPANQKDRMLAYFARGGSTLVLSSGMAMSPQTEFAQPLVQTWNDILKPYGVSVGSDMVFDRLSNQPIPMPSQFGQMYVGYPLWLRALSTKASVVNQDVDGVFLPWASSIDTTGAKQGTVTPLFVTSRAGGAEGFRVLIHPMRQWPSDNLKPRLVGVLVNPAAADANSDGAAKKDSTRGPAADTTAVPAGRIVVIGSTDFVVDRFLAPENATFVLNAVDWLAQDLAFIGIRSKDRSPPKLLFSSAATQDTVKYANVAGVPALLIILAAIRLWRRRRLQRRAYTAAGTLTP